MVYGFASLVTAFAGSFTAGERLPLIYFLICFPVLVLGVFAWLVSKHSGKLFAPSDFRNEDNYVKMQMSVVASLTAATAKSDTPASEAELHRRRFRSIRCGRLKIFVESCDRQGTDVE